MATTPIYTLPLSRFVDFEVELGDYDDERYDLEAAAEELGRRVAEAINPGEYFEAQHLNEINEGQMSAAEGWVVDPKADEAHFGELHYECDDDGEHCEIHREYDGNHCDEDCRPTCSEHCPGCECAAVEDSEDEIADEMADLHRQIEEAIEAVDLEELLEEHRREDEEEGD